MSSRDRQKALFDEAQAKHNAAQARSDNLSKQFDANEVTLADLETKLKAREGNLGELFGVTRQVAGDTAAIMYNSLTSAQFRGRDEFFTKMAKSKVLPTIPEFEQLAFELLREITETGRVARWKTEIVSAGGEKELTDVVRIGGFIAMTGDRYLDYNPKLGTFSVFARQPASELREAAEELSEAKSGYTRAFVDPSRGVLLAIYTQRPNVLERIEKGESVGYVIILVGLIGLVCSVYQAGYLFVVQRRVSHQLQHLDTPIRDNPLGRVLATFRGDAESLEDDVEVVELRISEAGAQGGAEDRALPGVPAPRRRCRPAARSGRHRDRYDHHLPEHHRVGLVRPEADGGRHRPGDDRNGSRARHRDPAPVHQRGARDDVAQRGAGARRAEQRPARGAHRAQGRDARGERKCLAASSTS
jgi:biopolymer transport protein ExbB